MPAAEGAHWSKDFVEHLRSVHFTLVAASVGLIFLVVSSKPYNSANALRDIEEIIELQRNWSPAWLVDNCKCQPDWLPQPNYDVSPFLLDVRPGPTPLQVAGTLNWKKGLQSNARPDRLVFVFPENNWAQDEHEAEVSQLQFPKTLAKFRTWWDALDKVRTIEVALSVRTEGWVSGSAEQLPDPNPSEDPGYIVLGVGRDTSNTSVQRVYLTIRKFGDHFLYGGVAQGVGRVFFPVAASWHVELDQERLHTLFNDWRPGPFEKSFSDLDRASSGLEALELQDVKKFVSDDVAKGAQVFKAFGLELPTEQVTFGGIIILLATQIYFFAYLRHLSGNLHPDDSGWDVPWIAMNPSILAQVISFVTLVLLPCTAIGLLGGRATSRISTDHWDRQIAAEVLAFMAAFALSLALGAWSWKFRPRVRQRVRSKQIVD